MIEIRHSDEPGLGWVQREYSQTVSYDAMVQLESLYAWVFRLLDLQPGTTLLDAACGRSQLVDMACARGVRATGVDYAFAPIRDLTECREGGYLTADGEQLPFTSNAFDNITSMGSLEHYVHIDQGVRELARVLAPQGKALIFVPNTFSLFHNVYMSMKTGYMLDDGQPLQRYGTRSQWEQLIEDNGLEIVSVHKYEREFPVYWKDVLYYLKNPKKLVYLMLTPVLPTNLAMCFAFVCRKKEGNCSAGDVRSGA